jgi:predicted dehydrogenase
VVTSTLSPDQESRVRLDYTDATVEVRHLYTHTNDDWRLHTGAGSPDGTARSAAEVLRAAWPARPPDPVSDHAAMFAAMLDARERGEAPPCSGEDGRAAFELVTACYASALTGRSVGRGDIAPGSPFHDRLDGGLSPWPTTDRYDR